jgi:predicted ATP-dependent endonuclease of OLD family
MYIEELHLQNFRGFKELKLQFPRNLAVIIGVNGSGKSSILDAIAIFLSIYMIKQGGQKMIFISMLKNLKI